LYKPALRARIEARCLREEIAFGGKVPGAEPLIAEAQRALEQCWWTSEEQAAREHEQLRQLGWPAWTLRVRAFLFRQ